MDVLTLTLLGAFFLKSGEQRQRIALLARHLGRYQIEKLMERLDEGYMRALGESDPGRQAQIWQLHEAPEQQLAQQFQRFADELGQASAPLTRVNRNPLPYAHRWLPAFLAPGFDLRELMRVHAQGIARALNHQQAQDARSKARADAVAQGIWPPKGGPAHLTTHMVSEDVVWAKLDAMRDGGAIASKRLWN